MDTLGHSDAPAACIVMEGSGRAGPSKVVNDAGGRKTHHLNARSARPLVPERISKLVLDLSFSKRKACSHHSRKRMQAVSVTTLSSKLHFDTDGNSLFLGKDVEF